MIYRHRHKSHVDLLECAAVTGNPISSYTASEKARSSHVHFSAQSSREARNAFVENLKVQIETDDYWIDSKVLAYCLQQAPITNALLSLDVDKADNEASPT